MSFNFLIVAVLTFKQGLYYVANDIELRLELYNQQ